MFFTRPFSREIPYVANQYLWPCPYCSSKTLEPSPVTLHMGKDRKGYLLEQQGEDMAWEQGGFVCILRCLSCKEPVTLMGRYLTTDDDCDDEGVINTICSFTPVFIWPAPPIIVFPNTTPQNVKDDLITSFSLFWADAESCANKLRSCLEKVLDHRRIQKTTIDHRNRRVRLSLHARIVIFRQRNHSLADLMMAVKWIGNAGSHAKPLNREDLLDGYEMIEHLLEQIYSQPEKKLAYLAKQINKTKKPRSTRKTRS